MQKHGDECEQYSLIYSRYILISALVITYQRRCRRLFQAMEWQDSYTWDEAILGNRSWWFYRGAIDPTIPLTIKKTPDSTDLKIKCRQINLPSHFRQ